MEDRSLNLLGEVRKKLFLHAALSADLLDRLAPNPGRSSLAKQAAAILLAHFQPIRRYWPATSQEHRLSCLFGSCKRKNRRQELGKLKLGVNSPPDG